MLDADFHAEDSNGAVLVEATTIETAVAGACAFFAATRLPLRVFDSTGREHLRLGMHDPSLPPDRQEPVEEAGHRHRPGPAETIELPPSTQEGAEAPSAPPPIPPREGES